jgi:hypothetical protein
MNNQGRAPALKTGEGARAIRFMVMKLVSAAIKSQPVSAMPQMPPRWKSFFFREVGCGGDWD